MVAFTLSMAESVNELAGKAAEVTEEAKGLGEKLSEAGLHTLLGMGIVFLVLVLISFIIYLLSFIGKAGGKKKEKTPVSVETVKTDGETEVGEDDCELVAVIAAAIAAYEGTDTTKFRVTSIRKTATKNIWKRGRK